MTCARGLTSWSCSILSLALLQHIRGVSGQFDAVLPGRALLVKIWAGGYYIVSFHSWAVFKVSLSSKTWWKQGLRCWSRHCSAQQLLYWYIGLELSQVLGRTLLCQCWEKKMPLTTMLCAILRHQLEKIFLCDLMSELHVLTRQSVMDQFPWSHSVLQKQCRFRRREQHLFV